MANELPYEINFMFDGTSEVKKKNGEVIGHWDTDSTDAIYEFTPLGEDKPTLSHPFMGVLVKLIQGEP